MESWHNIAPYRTESIHFLGLVNSETKDSIVIWGSGLAVWGLWGLGVDPGLEPDCSY